MSLTVFLKVPDLRERYSKVRKFSFLRESAYDVTSRCQLRCDGCYYFVGDKYRLTDQRDVETWRRFFHDEATRGITYVNLAGAEPSLVPDVLEAAASAFQYGTVFTNGLRVVPATLPFRIHVSVWGGRRSDGRFRPLASGKPLDDILATQLHHYRNDRRALFVYTFNEHNVDDVDEVVGRIRDAGCRLTFNIFSVPEASHTTLQPTTYLPRIHDKIISLLNDDSGTIVYSHYSSLVHTRRAALRALFGCPYPRAKLNDDFGISGSFRNYRTDLTHTREHNCCVPDTSCTSCRHYAAGSAIVTSALTQHVSSEAAFRGWLDYMDTYLATWLVDYKRGVPLFDAKHEATLRSSESADRWQ
jgi:hypothetical protein